MDHINKNNSIIISFLGSTVARGSTLKTKVLSGDASWKYFEICVLPRATVLPS